MPSSRLSRWSLLEPMRAYRSATRYCRRPFPVHGPHHRLAAATRRALAKQPHAADVGHLWTGRTFSAGWSSQHGLLVRLVVPEVVAEVAVDVARDIWPVADSVRLRASVLTGSGQLHEGDGEGGEGHFYGSVRFCEALFECR
ncbi:hypothetical protein GTZ78_07460 [Streptomyces sp. SID8361]|uniref:hypothetical protein n=1 Tax=Streptomyces sp. MnatMP-M27 TaxID=1839768 RepID=UPI00081D8FED|nr:hypothetical protein [Streptomyces sp. MnatMP-M27]MYU10530.1 hypothetical protein [Streptomyces sp. SID8361]SCF72861.1 hypothetical protein GA0115260_1018710 [Streptomyces sp. MnatMP-M27]